MEGSGLNVPNNDIQEVPHKSKGIPCKLCDQNFSCKNSLKIHTHLIHGKSKPPKNRTKSAPNRKRLVRNEATSWKRNDKEKVSFHDNFDEIMAGQQNDVIEIGEESPLMQQDDIILIGDESSQSQSYSVGVDGGSVVDNADPKGALSLDAEAPTQHEHLGRVNFPSLRKALSMNLITIRKQVALQTKEAFPHYDAGPTSEHETETQADLDQYVSNIIEKVKKDKVQQSLINEALSPQPKNYSVGIEGESSFEDAYPQEASSLDAAPSSKHEHLGSLNFPSLRQALNINMTVQQQSGFETEIQPQDNQNDYNVGISPNFPLLQDVTDETMLQSEFKEDGSFDTDTDSLRNDDVRILKEFSSKVQAPDARVPSSSVDALVAEMTAQQPAPQEVNTICFLFFIIFIVPNTF